MTSGSRNWYSLRVISAIVTSALLMCVLILPAQEHKRLVVYAFRGATFIPVSDHDGKEFVPLNDVLQPMGGSAVQVNQKIKIRSGKAEGECILGGSKCSLRGNQLDLGANIWLNENSPMVPLRSLPQMLSLLLDTRFDYHASSRRLFLPGSVIRFTAEAKKGDASSIVFTFSEAVNPTLSTEPGRLHMDFTRDAISSGPEQYKFESAQIPSANYAESNGTAEIVVHGNAPLMAVFSDGGKTITVSATSAAMAAESAPPVAAAAAATPAAASATNEVNQANAPSSASTLPLIPVLPRGGRFVVVIDASHGGDDAGAQLTEKLTEKDITLAIGRRLRGELQNRGVAAFMERDNDSTIGLDDRAAAANAAHATLYIALHAATDGHGVRVYSSILRSGSAEDAPGGFISWERAQASASANSRAFAVAMVEDLAGHKLPAEWSPAPVRPLNNIVGMAIALEVAPPPQKDAAALANGNYQQMIAASLADSILAARGRLEAK